MSAKRIVGTTMALAEDGSTVRRAMLFEYVQSTRTWVAQRLPLAVGAIESVVMDANSDGTVVGGCVFSGDSLPNRIVGCVWRVPQDSGPLSIPALLFHGGTACPDSTQFVQSVLTAVGPVDADGTCVAAGVVNTVCDGELPRAFGLFVYQDPFDLAVTPASSVFCEALEVPCGGPQAPASVAIYYADAVGWDPDLASRRIVVGSGHRRTGAEAVCGNVDGWAGGWWNPEGGLLQTIRAPVECDLLGNPTLPAVQLPNGTLAQIRSVHVSSVGASPMTDDVAPIAGGALGTDFSDWSSCQSHDCYPVHAAVFLHPFAGESSVLTFDVHYSTVERQDIDQVAYISSWVARACSTLGLDTDWMAVGVRSEQDSPTSESSEGVIWAGKTHATTFGWCGRSMVDDSAIQRRAFIDTCSGVPIGLVTTTAVHDLLPTGVAIGVGTVGSSCGGGESQLILLTEACDINGDLEVDKGDLELLLNNWELPDNPCDLTGDGTAGDPDLRIMMQAMGSVSGGRAALIQDLCADYWAKTNPLPYTAAAHALGFQGFDEYGDFVASLPPDQAVHVCCLVTAIAQALVGD